MNIIPVETIDEVLEIAFTLDSTYAKTPAKKTKAAKASKGSKPDDKQGNGAQA